MKPALVKIDVAVIDLGQSVRKVAALADGSTLREHGLLWVFNLARDLKARRRDLRFWRAELLAHAQGDAGKYRHMNIEEVIATILPLKRESFYPGELDQLLQIRHNTRIDYGTELRAIPDQGGHRYPRPALAEFLQRRWLGARKGLEA